MFLNRRKLLSSVAALGAAMAIPGLARAEEEVDLGHSRPQFAQGRSQSGPEHDEGAGHHRHA